MRLEGVKHLRGSAILDRQRKQRAKDHIGGSMAGVALNIKPSAISQRGQPCNRPLPGRDHRPKRIPQPPSLERRVNDAPLPPPCGAIGDKD